MLHPADPERPGSPLHLIDILLPPDYDFCVSSGQRNEQVLYSPRESVGFVNKCNYNCCINIIFIEIILI